jgi:transcriptional regulator with XRE-family HTH domain
MNTPKSRISIQKGLPMGQNVKRIREAQGLSMELVAGEIGLDADAYALIEADQSVVSEALLLQLSKTLRVSIIDLLSVQYQPGFSSHDSDKESDARSQNGEMERLERLYQEQINLLRDEISFLRNMLEAASKKD